jgi:hypothetical protein
VWGFVTLSIRWYCTLITQRHCGRNTQIRTRVPSPYRVFPILQTLVLWTHSNPSPKSLTMSNSECSLLEEQTQERPRFCKEFAIPPRVQRSIGLVHGESASRHVLILSPAFDLIVLARFNSTLPKRLGRLILVGDSWSWRPCSQRGEHNIEDEVVFSSHQGYVFHDSRGFEAGGEDELKAVQEFVRRKSQETKLGMRLHAIWCVPFGICNCASTRVSFQVLRFDGQWSAIARFEALWQYLSG